MQFKLKPDLNFLAVGSIVIGGLVEAAQQALSSTSELVKKFPYLDLTGMWNYVPLACIAVAGFLFLVKQIAGSKNLSPRTAAGAAFIPSSVKIQFSSGNVWPTHIAVENISWYALRNHFQIASVDVTTGATQTQTLFTWSLFISFDEHTPYGQLVVDGNGAVLPHYEVKITTQRYAVIMFEGDLANLVLTVKALK